MFVNNFRHGKKWLPGHILHHRGPLLRYSLRMVVPVIVTKIRFGNVSAKTDPLRSLLRRQMTHFPTVRGDTDGSANPATLPAALSDDGSTEQQQQMTNNASTPVAETDIIFSVLEDHLTI